jgi:group I intron endonuclease
MIIYSIYKIVNQVNGKIYIGFTSKNNPFRRWTEHINSSNSGSNLLLHKAVRKYGTDKFIFTVLYQSLDKYHTLHVMEPKFICEYKSFSESGYNLTFGGEGTFGHTKTPWNKDKTGIYSNSTLKILSEKAKSRDSSRIGTKHTEDTKNKIRAKALTRDRNLHPSRKGVLTPSGEFSSMIDAAKYYGKSPAWMTKQLQINPQQFKLVTDSLSSSYSLPVLLHQF